MRIYQWLSASFIVVAGIGFLAVYVLIQSTYAWRIDSIESVTPRPVVLVLGSSVKGRKPNSILEERLDAASRLYDRKAAKKIILSGDNRTIDYNEPQAMKEYLVDKGIPEADLILDHAGRRTYDSCYRARNIFDVDSVIIVTQTFHLPRALYLCNALGVNAVGVA
ncbi:MAG: ElyC/SanA/YdcF family protein, partial [Candidatus Uhrbacteria bacterium]|nr:ElyC/SanA/YdcF family protein [Candidatus Uhrbacteria bacterium]